MADPREVEIQVLRDVIEAVEARLRAYEAGGGVAVRSEVLAAVVYAVIASARASGHYGAGSLARAPILDEILGGVEENPWEAAVYTVVLAGALTG